MVGANVEFSFATVADEERFVREYLVDAWDRFEESEFFERGWFWRYGPYQQYKGESTGGLVRIVFEGDPEALVAAEGTRWDEFEGLTEWQARKGKEGDSLLVQQQVASGEQVGEWDYRIKPLVTRFVLDYYREFPEPLAMILDDDEIDRDYGYWTALHYLVVLAGYDRYEETDGALRMTKSRVYSIATYQGAERAREEYERLLEAWKDYGDELETWIDENPTGQSERTPDGE